MSNHHDENDINDLGVQADLSMWQRKPLERRRILQLGIVGIGALLTSCSSASGSGASACVSKIPEETAGPYPANGSSGGPGDGDPVGTPPGPPTGEAPPANASPPSAMQSGDGEAVNVLTRSGVVRSDITTSLETGNTA